MANNNTTFTFTVGDAQQKEQKKEKRIQFDSPFQPADLLNRPPNTKTTTTASGAESQESGKATLPVSTPVSIPLNLQFYKEKTNAPIVVNPILSASDTQPQEVRPSSSLLLCFIYFYYYLFVYFYSYFQLFSFVFLFFPLLHSMG
jgi:hypothetical protein